MLKKMPGCFYFDICPSLFLVVFPTQVSQVNVFRFVMNTHLVSLNLMVIIKFAVTQQNLSSTLVCVYIYTSILAFVLDLPTNCAQSLRN